MLKITTYALFLNLLATNLLSTCPSFSAEQSYERVGKTKSTSRDRNSLDLQGNGQFTQVNLPFDYFEKKRSDKLTLIHQGGYKIYEIDKSQNQVAVIGPLRPCIGIVVTDGKRLIAFHKHSTNSLESMENLMRENLDFSCTKNLFARIYTARDDVEWEENKRSLMHGGKTHIQEVKNIKDYLEKMGMIRDQIIAQIYNIRDAQNNLIYSDCSLGKYELAEVSVAVRLDDIFTEDEKRKIKFFSIDPFNEDVFGFEGKMLSYEEYFGPNLEEVKDQLPTSNYSEPFINYSQIPASLKQLGQTDGYKVQRGVCETRLKKEENESYFRYFNEVETKLMGRPYNSLEFYPLQ